MCVLLSVSFSIPAKLVTDCVGECGGLDGGMLLTGLAGNWLESNKNRLKFLNC